MMPIERKNPKIIARTGKLPATQAMLYEFRAELKSDISSLEFRMNKRFDEVKSEIHGVKSEIHGVKSEIHGVKSEIHGVKSEIHGVKSEIHGLRSEIHELKSEIHGTIKGEIQGL